MNKIGKKLLNFTAIIFVVFILFLNPLKSKAQLNLQIVTNKIPLISADGDTISVCRDSVIQFVAVLTNAGLPVIPDVLFWNFDDGNEISGSGADNDTLVHSFVKGGGYRVKLTARYSGIDVFSLKPVRIAVAPDYSKTETDMPKDWKGICSGSNVKITGKANSILWKDSKFNSKITEDTPKEISDTKNYTKIINFDEFALNRIFSVGDFDSIGLNIEHSNVGNLQIKLTCPNGNSAILKDFSLSNNQNLGIPVEDETSSAGSGIDYFFATSTSNGKMNDYTTNSIPSNVYTSDQSFTNFTGCPLNGNWKLEILDNLPLDNGFLFSWKILFNKNITPKTWNFRDTLINYYSSGENDFATFWEGEKIGSTLYQSQGDTLIIATTNAKPESKSTNNKKYTFNVVNNWGCPQDTAIFIKVESVSFDITPPTGETILNAKFTNTTSWGKTYKWDFGDKTASDITETPSHEYPDEGTFVIKLTVTDSLGCVDSDTAKLIVTLKPSDVKVTNNVFTPNGDGLNDYFKIQTAESLKNFQFIIYSNWGEKVYETNSADEAIEIGWNGKLPVTKLKASPGTYYFVLIAEGKDGKAWKEKGTLQLFR